ncbi:hypothetical protein CYPRO_1989 [Cyclonatronum proteinivorum]|uniref:AAA domain-containing protein n=1 Tax=Cyclonatronum proteinivorum TaxID=1457365 RepID=A0A345UL87_9BACT|nr:AAA family ATPase [Cyclonatronum proteinivorum]AXJ01239.1 hypothetical protein CYPRO_1989 [Cyclonatronum proteinivorum]
MDPLFTFHLSAIRQVDRRFTRFLYDNINWDQRMLAIKGPRGAGKTTLMLQRIKFGLSLSATQALYVTADHYWFYTHTLFETAEAFYLNGGRFLFIDEVHKYPYWARELKNMYDGFPELRIVFSASSALDIYRGGADLSRRVMTYELPGMSFREYLGLKQIFAHPTLSLEELLLNHESVSADMLGSFQPLPLFRSYLSTGYLPIIVNTREEDVPALLNQIINTVVESDLSVIANFDGGTAQKIKKLLGVIAESVPFKPNISAIARKLNVSRESVYAWFTYLDEARLLNMLTRKGKGISTLQKPEKVFLENTNLSYALRQTPDAGSLRESFVMNQLSNAGLKPLLPETGDFLVEDVHIEVGGKQKTARQLSGANRSFIAADDIEQGYGNKLPLWLLGFLY